MPLICKLCKKDFLTTQVPTDPHEKLIFEIKQIYSESSGEFTCIQCLKK
jgi:hypothetical protein